MTDIPALPAGCNLGHFEIRRALGANGTVLTYRAHDVRSQEKVWIEELLPVDVARRSADGRAVEPVGARQLKDFEALRGKFLRQGGERKSLTHPALPAVREVIEENGTGYLVIAAAEGTPLEDRFGESDRPWSWEETAALGLPCLEAIAQLHALGLVHLDIHPGNILVRESAPPLLLGAAGLPELRAHHAAPAYSAVETQVRESIPGPAADLYALGAVLYRCLSGIPPPEATRRLAALTCGEADPLHVTASYGEGRPGPFVMDTLSAMLRVLPHERLASAAIARDRLNSRRQHAPAGRTTGSAAGTKSRQANGEMPSAARRSASATVYLRWLWAPAIVIGAAYAYQAWQFAQREERVPAAGPAAPDISRPPAEAEKKPPVPAEGLSRPQDAERIQRYREIQQLEKTAAERVEAGHRHLAEGRLTEPEEQNAVAEFRAALALDAKNAEARKGLNEVGLRLQRQAEEALRAGNLEEAQGSLDRLAGVAPEQKRLGELRTALAAAMQKRAEEARIAEQQQLLERERLRQIEEWLGRAEAALRQDQLATPVGTSALDYFRQVLSLAPEHESAKEGMRRIAARYLDLSREALARDRLDEADLLLNSAAAVRPDESGLPVVRSQIQARRQAFAQAAERERSRREQAQALQERDRDKASTEQDKRRQEAELKAGLDAYYASSYAEAHALLRPLAEQGVARAQFRMAVMYQRGRGVEPNAELAQEWARKSLPNLRRAAEAGEAWAQSDLGTLYEQGFVLDKDEAEAVRWYRRAATQGYAGAQTNLGVMYAQGRGVEQSREQAVLWLRRAAEQGDRLARENLRALNAE